MVGIIYALPASGDEICVILPALGTSAVEHKQRRVESHLEFFNWISSALKGVSSKSVNLSGSSLHLGMPESLAPSQINDNFLIHSKRPMRKSGVGSFKKWAK